MKQQTLALKGNNEPDVNITDKAPDKIRLTGKPLWRRFPITENKECIVTGAVIYESEGDKTEDACLSRIVFYDAKGVELPGPYEDISYSSKVGSYSYLNICNTQRPAILLSVKSPDNAKAMALGFQTWNADKNIYILPELVVSAGKLEKDLLKEEMAVLGWPACEGAGGKPVVLAVMNDFTAGCFNENVNLIRPRPDNWLPLASRYRPSLIFIESAWQGNSGSWKYRVGQYPNKPGNEIAQMAKYGREHNIPVVFWNNEDPVCHDKFLCIAKLADMIFTTDNDMIAPYQRETGNKKVYSLPFAAHPSLHKPAPLGGRRPGACFASGWYSGCHEEREDEMRWLLKAAKPFNLVIYDHNFSSGMSTFPDEYKNNIKGKVSYEELCAEYRNYRVFLNVNSVAGSHNMFSRRVFELLASGTPVVSGYSRGIEEALGPDIVWMADIAPEAQIALETLLGNDEEWRRRSLAGIRKVFSEHTYLHRLQYIFDKSGVEHSLRVEPKILLMAVASSKQDVEALIKIAGSQSYKHFVLCIEMDNSHPADENIVFVKKGGLETFYAGCVSDGYDFAGWLDPAMAYGEHYLQDLVNATRYAPDMDAWGKSIAGDFFMPGMPVYAKACLYRFRMGTDMTGKRPGSDVIQGMRVFCADSSQFRPVVDN